MASTNGASWGSVPATPPSKTATRRSDWGRWPGGGAGSWLAVDTTRSGPTGTGRTFGMGRRARSGLKRTASSAAPGGQPDGHERHAAHAALVVDRDLAAEQVDPLGPLAEDQLALGGGDLTAGIDGRMQHGFPGQQLLVGELWSRAQHLVDGRQAHDVELAKALLRGTRRAAAGRRLEELGDLADGALVSGQQVALGRPILLDLGLCLVRPRCAARVPTGTRSASRKSSAGK